MSLSSLPNEILSLVAQKLDVTSSIAFENTNLRLREVAIHSPTTFVKEKKLTKEIVEYVVRRGVSTQCLDLANCDASRDCIGYVVSHCPNVRSLSLVNTALDYGDFLKILQPLRNLRKLLSDLGRRLGSHSITDCSLRECAGALCRARARSSVDGASHGSVERLRISRALPHQPCRWRELPGEVR